MLSPLSDQKLQLQHSIRLETHLFFRKSENAQKMLQWAEMIFEGAFLFPCPAFSVMIRNTLNVCEMLGDCYNLRTLYI